MSSLVAPMNFHAEIVYTSHSLSHVECYMCASTSEGDLNFGEVEHELHESCDTLKIY